MKHIYFKVEIYKRKVGANRSLIMVSKWRNRGRKTVAQI